MANVSDVARLAGVSPGIVSRVLNEDESLRVRAETRRKIVDAATKLDYTPNHAARALRRSRVGVIGLAVHNASNPVYEEIIQGAQDEALRAGYMLVLADIDALATNEKVFKQVISSGALDGLLLQRAGTASDVFIARAASERLPMILMNEMSTTGEGSVAADDFAAAKLATTHLIALGHKSIGLLRMSGDHVRSSVRFAGWSEAQLDAGQAPDLNLIRDCGQTIESGFTGMSDLLNGRPEVSAVMVSNVMAAVGALRACADRGLAVPADISIIAVHDADAAQYSVPRLSVVRLPLVEMGRQAMALMLERLEKVPSRHVTITDPAPELILRESTARPRETVRH